MDSVLLFLAATLTLVIAFKSSAKFGYIDWSKTEVSSGSTSTEDFVMNSMNSDAL